MDPQLDIDIDLGTEPPKVDQPKRDFIKPIPEQPDCYVLEFDNSTMEQFLTCKRKAYYQVIVRRELSLTRTALHFGSVLHSALEPRFRLEDNWEEKMHEAVDIGFKDFYVPVDDHRTPERAHMTVDGYNKKYPLADEPFHAIRSSDGIPHVELPFAIPLHSFDVNATIESSNGPVFCKHLYIVWVGKIDAIVQWRGKLWVLDHKTASVLGRSYYDQWWLSSQMHGYAWAGQHLLGQPIEGAIVDVLGVKKVNTEFQRQPYEYRPDQLDEWKADTIHHLGDFVNCLRVNHFPKGTQWCVGKYGTCPYLDVCRLPSDQRGIVLDSPLYSNVNWTPLT